MLRLFVGWRLTLDSEDLLSKSIKNRNSRQDSDGSAQILSDLLRSQSVPKVPSNQLPSLYNLRTIDYPKQQPGLNAWITKYIKPEYILRLKMNYVIIKIQEILNIHTDYLL